MLELSRSQDAYLELVASSRNTGERPGYHLATGTQGEVLYNRPFEFGEDDPSDIDPISLSTGDYMAFEVSECIPDASLDTAIILHSDPEAKAEPEEIQVGRKIVMDSVYRAIKSSKINGDTTELYMIGSEDPDISDTDAEHIDDTETPESAADAALEIMQRPGLAVVISTFKNLPLPQRLQLKQQSIDRTQPINNVVGIKANHIWDLTTPVNTGRKPIEWPTGLPSMPIVEIPGTSRRIMNKNKPSAEMVKYQEYLKQEHMRICKALASVGMAMAEVIFDRSIPPFGFHIDQTDRSLAMALQQLRKQ
jgi:hypothetical protein